MSDFFNKKELSKEGPKHYFSAAGLIYRLPAVWYIAKWNLTRIFQRKCILQSRCLNAVALYVTWVPLLSCKCNLNLDYELIVFIMNAVLYRCSIELDNIFKSINL